MSHANAMHRTAIADQRAATIMVAEDERAPAKASRTRRHGLLLGLCATALLIGGGFRYATSIPSTPHEGGATAVPTQTAFLASPKPMANERRPERIGVPITATVGTPEQPARIEVDDGLEAAASVAISTRGYAEESSTATTSPATTVPADAPPSQKAADAPMGYTTRTDAPIAAKTIAAVDDAINELTSRLPTAAQQRIPPITETTLPPPPSGATDVKEPTAATVATTQDVSATSTRMATTEAAPTTGTAATKTSPDAATGATATITVAAAPSAPAPIAATASAPERKVHGRYVLEPADQLTLYRLNAKASETPVTQALTKYSDANVACESQNARKSCFVSLIAETSNIPLKLRIGAAQATGNPDDDANAPVAPSRRTPGGLRYVLLLDGPPGIDPANGYTVLSQNAFGVLPTVGRCNAERCTAAAEIDPVAMQVAGSRDDTTVTVTATTAQRPGSEDMAIVWRFPANGLRSAFVRVIQEMDAPTPDQTAFLTPPPKAETPKGNTPRVPRRR